ncbi:MAG: hypothetical protein OEZ25_08385 [Candidatus Bathyarchaeota archaeon]|nr:hypothetical protein [Candidatus Bathyarchaeota archaeon]
MACERNDTRFARIPKRKKKIIPMTRAKLPFLRVNVIRSVTLAMKRGKLTFARYVRNTVVRLRVTVSGAKMHKTKIGIMKKRRIATPTAERSFAVRIERLFKGYTKMVCIVPFSRSFPTSYAIFFKSNTTKIMRGRPIKEFTMRKAKYSSGAPIVNPPKPMNAKGLKVKRKASTSRVGNL